MTWLAILVLSGNVASIALWHVYSADALNWTTASVWWIAVKFILFAFQKHK